MYSSVGTGFSFSFRHLILIITTSSSFLNVSKSDNHWFWFGEKNQNLEEGDHSGYFKNLKELAIFMKELRVIKAVI
jgi:hypothetical protein